MNKKQTSQEIKSLKMHFDTWLRRADEKDKALTCKMRKGKWILILIGFFLLFASSFVLLPMVHVIGHQLESPVKNTDQERKIESSNSTFEMPVDSFENQIKKNLHENLSKKK